MMVSTKADVISVLQKHQNELKEFGVRRFGLFGSFLSGQITAESDVDLIVEFEPDQKNFVNYSNLIFYLEELFQRPVEVITPESLSPYIGPHILREVEYVSSSS